MDTWYCNGKIYLVYKVRLENGLELYNYRKFLKVIKENLLREKWNHHSISDFKIKQKIETVKYYIDIENSDNEGNIDQ